MKVNLGLTIYKNRTWNWTWESNNKAVLNYLYMYLRHENQ